MKKWPEPLHKAFERDELELGERAAFYVMSENNILAQTWPFPELLIGGDGR